jgi:excisionase family DNA binding protein
MPPILPEQQSPYDGGAAPFFDRFAYSIEETARITSVGRTAVYEEIKAGRLRACKVGRRTVVIADDIRQWLASLPQINGAA